MYPSIYKNNIDSITVGSIVKTGLRKVITENINVDKQIKHNSL